jgi:serine/threonine protein kinase
LADFGYAAFASNKHITIAGTEYWRAPEIGSRIEHTLEQAKMSDVFSFGILCFWIVFHKQLGKEMRSSDYSPWWQSVKRSLGLSSPSNPAEQLLANHNTPNASRNTMKALALRLVGKMPDVTWKKQLGELFESTLEADEKSRSRFFESKTEPEFAYIMRLLSENM